MGDEEAEVWEKWKILLVSLIKVSASRPLWISNCVLQSNLNIFFKQKVSFHSTQSSPFQILSWSTRGRFPQRGVPWLCALWSKGWSIRSWSVIWNGRQASKTFEARLNSSQVNDHLLVPAELQFCLHCVLAPSRLLMKQSSSLLYDQQFALLRRNLRGQVERHQDIVLGMVHELARAERPPCFLWTHNNFE